MSQILIKFPRHVKLFNQANSLLAAANILTMTMMQMRTTTTIMMMVVRMMITMMWREDTVPKKSRFQIMIKSS